MNPKFERGVWLGVNQRRGEDLIGTPDGVLKASVVKSVPEEERWNKDDIMNMKGALVQPTKV